MKVTILDLLTEMETWLGFEQVTKDQAAKSAITNLNNIEFSKLVRQWQEGYFDEDPHVVGMTIENLLAKEQGVKERGFKFSIKR
jgi:hypothetical protein